MQQSAYYARQARRRTAEEVVADHLTKLQQGAVDEDISRNYAEDAVVLSATGVHRGHPGARRAAKTLLKALGDARLEIRRQVVSGEYAFVEWTASDGRGQVVEGADTFVVRLGRIAAHTNHYVSQTQVQH